jgi:hypothetical protein
MPLSWLPEHLVRVLRRKRMSCSSQCFCETMPHMVGLNKGLENCTTLIWEGQENLSSLRTPTKGAIGKLGQEEVAF